MKDGKHVVILDMVFICESVIPKHCATKLHFTARAICKEHLTLSTVKACPKKNSKHEKNQLIAANGTTLSSAQDQALTFTPTYTYILCIYIYIHLTYDRPKKLSRNMGLTLAMAQLPRQRQHVSRSDVDAATPCSAWCGARWVASVPWL